MTDHPVQAILFDLDGVLVNAKDWHFEAFNHALASFGYQPIAHQEHLARYDGLPTLKKLEILAPGQFIPASQFAGIEQAKQRFTVELIEEKCLPSPQHLEMLRWLQQHGYRMAVCSNSVRASVDLLLARSALTGFFEFTLSNNDVANPKPDPEIYLAALQRMNILPQKALILEDNKNGITAAYASGAHVYEVADIKDVCRDTLENTLSRIRGDVL